MFLNIVQALFYILSKDVDLSHSPRLEVYLQMLQIIYMSIYWFVIMRFKRIQVQVSQDERETTYGMFLKLRYIKRYTLVFIGSMFLFQIPCALMRFIYTN